ncbi:energy transducer TonB [Campylobacter novaezeelandiae]|uniref:TonB C-terminal domain-containing protein n=1 Tax=Campylobacter novaezeelandiae TaxID=2267891 RepID=UPI001037CED7|nr:TonB C-terminal domain-containing protein [Campylobacter novaezeelandiae]QWU79462.1 Tol-Pal system subunit TolA [Campylobacter novaezeelandiae]TBR78153.1 energy transducer TonB [Campylobacter novaezeelandiae]TBR80238.1 energy transducer TonB [Campylobacter novaezeelandiae]
MKNYGLGNLNSFLLALIVYFLVILIVFFRITAFKDPSIKYTDLEDSFIDIELTQSSNKIANSDINKEVDIAKLFEKTTNKFVQTENIDQKETNFNDLFGNVKDIQDEKTTKVQSSAKPNIQNNSSDKNASQLVKNLENTLLTQNSNTDSIQIQRTGIYDEFLGKITRIIEERWKLNKSQGNLSVRVKIFIDSNGKFGYTSVEKSNDIAFDKKVMDFLENLQGKFIAYPPKNQSINITMNLSDELIEIKQ